MAGFTPILCVEVLPREYPSVELLRWFFNNGEPWPRGQTCARQMVSEIAEGNWIEAFKVKHMDKYTAPTVEGVDYPSIGIDTA